MPVYLKILICVLVIVILSPFLFLLFAYVNSLFINEKKEYNKNSKYFRWLLNTGSRKLIFLSRTKLHLKGLEKLPQNTRFLLICNHRSNFDPIISWYTLRKFDIAYISKPENFKIFAFGRIIRRCCFIPIQRGNPRLAFPVFERASELMKANEVSIGIYPEGTRSKSKNMLPFRNGALKIAQKANVPIVVSSIQGTESIHKNFPLKKTHVYFEILEVIPVEKVNAMKTIDLGDYCHDLIEKNLTDLS